MNNPIQLEPSWQLHLADHLVSPGFGRLRAFIHEEVKNGQAIAPQPEQIFRAFELTPFENVRVVILGQDPYHGVGQAEGLAFSVPRGLPLPPSLRNIQHEIMSETMCPPFVHGHLSSWTEQGVLLLNSVLTVRLHQAASHARQGWEEFTDAAITAMSREREGIVFLLWGRYAQGKAHLIDQSRHHVLTAGHPSPLSVRYFRGCGHFTQTNQILTERGEAPIDWSIV